MTTYKVRMLHILSVYQDWQDKPFVWGEYDCLNFAAACLMPGTSDPTEELRSSYRSEREAIKIMATNGWKNIGDVIAAFWPEKHPSLAQTGNWCEISNPDGKTLVGVIIGPRAAAQSMKGGPSQVPMSRVLRVFEC